MPNDESPAAVPSRMRASVYRGENQVEVEGLPVPRIGPGELLVRVGACGICHTDLKKIEYGLLPPPRIFGHETAGEVAAVGEGVKKFSIGDRVCLFHHIPCMDCFYCERGNYAQCPTYKKVGITAGFEPAGGGFSQYVRVMPWIVERGVERVPADVSLDRATFVEPVNTCVKAVDQAALRGDETVLILGQGPIGLIFTALLGGTEFSGGMCLPHVFATDQIPSRLELARQFGAADAWNFRTADPVETIKQTTSGRGADLTIVAASAPGIVEQALKATRPGGRVLLFAQTSSTETFQSDGAQVCKEERTVFGSYSADVTLQQQTAEIVWQSGFPAERLISNFVSLEELAYGMELARNPREGSLKVVVHPQS